MLVYSVLNLKTIYNCLIEGDKILVSQENHTHPC